MIGNVITRLSVLASSFCILVLLWHECGENPAVFCYRMGHGFLRVARNRALVAVPVSDAARLPMRLRANRSCLTRSSTFSVRSTAQKD